MRKTAATTAREALQQTWPQENAAAKETLLEEMLVNAGDEDVAWLESLLNEKSAKVKEAALQVLKTIPSSTIVQSYWTLFKTVNQVDDFKRYSRHRQQNITRCKTCRR